MAIGENITLSQILEQMARWPAIYRGLVLVGVFVLVLIVYGFTLYGAQSNKLTRFQGELTSLQTKINQGRNVQKNLKSFEEEQERLRQSLEEALNRLPNEKELPVLLTNISSQGKKAGLEFRSFRPSAEIMRGFYAEVPISIEFLGAYHDVGVFFDRISRLARIVNVTELNMKVEDHSSLTPRLKVEGIATTFRFIDQPVGTEGGA